MADFESVKAYFTQCLHCGKVFRGRHAACGCAYQRFVDAELRRMVVDTDRLMMGERPDRGLTAYDRDFLAQIGVQP